MYAGKTANRADVGILKKADYGITIPGACIHWCEHNTTGQSVLLIQKFHKS
jgi:hypothetical protein